MTNMKKVETIAMIGAGWAGLQISKILIDCGYKVSIYEELNDVAGTWHPALAYHGQGLHSPFYITQFWNFAIPPNRNGFKRIEWLDVFENCKNYCKAKNLYQHIEFNSKVKQIHYDSTTGSSTLTIENTLNKQSKSLTFDFVISTQFNAPRLPTFKNQDKFKGKIYHSIDIKESTFNEIVKDNKNVMIVGGSKSATDLTYLFAKRNYNVTWVLREMYWFASYEKTWYDHKRGKQTPWINRMIFFLGLLGLSKRITAIPTFIILRLLGVIQCPGKKHSNYKKFHIGLLDYHQLDTIRAAEKVYSEIETLNERTITLKNGQVVDCDVLICATGCDPLATQIQLFRDNVPVKYENVNSLYQYAVIPEMPKLCFTGFCLLGFSLLRSVNLAAWVIKYIENNLSTDELKKLSTPKLEKQKTIFGNALFDNTEYLFISMRRQMLGMLEGMLTERELIGCLYDEIVAGKADPFPGVVSYINDRIKSK